MKIYCFNLKHLFATLFLLFAMENFAQDVRKLYIDPSQAYGGKVSEYFESVEYIPLETTKESLFGNILKLIITDSGFVIMDYDTKAILFFALDGRFITRIKYKLVPPSLSYNVANKDISIITFDYANEKMDSVVYTLMGYKKNAKKINLNSAKYGLNLNFIPLGDGYNLNIKDFSKAFGYILVDTTANLLYIYKNGELQKSFFPLNTKENFLMLKKFRMLIENPVLNNSNDIFITVPILNEVLKVNKDTTILAYKFIFPVKYSIPKNIIEIKSDEEYKKYEMQLSKPNNYIFTVRNFFKVKENIFFRLETSGSYYLPGSTDANSSFNFIYNIATNRLTSLERIMPDAMTNYLSISTRNNATRGLKFYNDYFYGSASSLEMFSEYEKNKFRNPKYPPVLQNYFKTENRKSNPVIIKMKE